MKVTIKLFGAPRLALHTREREMDVADGATVSDLVGQFVEQMGPTAREYLLDPKGRGYVVAFGVNGQVAETATVLHEGDVVALMPPTAGGRCE